MWRGQSSVQSLSGFNESELVSWAREDRQRTKEEPAYYTPEPGDLDKPINAKSLAQELWCVWNGCCTWQEVCFLQFLGIHSDDIQEVITAAPELQRLAGAGYQRLLTT